MRKMFRAQSTKLLVIKDTPQSIALGAAIGVLLGFTPLFGLKTLLTLLLAALFRVNKISAVVAVSLHDLLLPLWPVVLRLEFNIGYWLLHEPHQLPARLNLHHLDYRAWFHWNYFVTVGGPTLLGSVILGVPASVAVYALLKWELVRRRQRQAEADDSVQ